MTPPRLLAALAFVAAYYAIFAFGLPQWVADGALLVPAGTAAVLLARRARRERGRAAAFFALLALGASIWTVANGLWTAAEMMGHTPYSTQSELRGFPLALDVLFLGFLVPMMAALPLRAHPRVGAPTRLALVEAGLAALAVSFVFLRLTLLPLLARPNSWRAMQGMLWFVLAVTSAVLWRLQRDARWRHTHGALALFALSYAALSSIAQALGRVLQPGGPADLAWILPFGLLALAAGEPRPAAPPRARDATLVLACAVGPLLFDGTLSLVLPPAGLDFPPRPGLLVAATAVLVLGAALRLAVQDAAARAAHQAGRGRVEEAQRTARLAELARLAGPLVPRIEAAVDEVARRTWAAASVLGAKADRALEQAGRARELVGRLAAVMLPPLEPREELDLAALVESCVHEALERGPALSVTLEGLGTLPPVYGARQALAACFVQLVRNAAQASPGGMLRIIGRAEEDAVVLRFVDDGPGVAPELRHRVFEPFFTTRRVGEGFGLGLSQVHYVLHDHGGSVQVEPSVSGACFAVRLPAREAPAPERPAQEWPLAAAVVSAAALSLVLVLVPAALRQQASIYAQIGAAGVTAAALGFAAARHTGRARLFWASLAAGPGLWAVTRVLRLAEAGPANAGYGTVWHYLVFALADLSAAAALLVRPDQPRQRQHSSVRLLGVAAAFCLCVFIYAYLILLPGPFGAWDPALRDTTSRWAGGYRLGLAAWLLVLALRAATPYWRSVFSRLGLLVALLGLGQMLASLVRGRPEYAGAPLAALGWMVPLLLLAGFALSDALGGRREALPAPVETGVPAWSAASLACLAALPAFDALMAPSAHPDLDAARRGLTWAAVVVVGALLAAREYFVHRDPPARRRSRPSSGSRPVMEPDRLLKVVSAAVYEMAGHVSGIGALARLVLTQSDASGRVRGDAERIQSRADLAARIARNLVALLQGGAATPELCSVNRLVEEVVQLRGADLEAEGIRLARTLDPELPAVWWVHAPAIRQALLCCIDSAVVALRGAGRGGTVELTTLQQGDELVVRLRGDGQGLPRGLLAPLTASRPDARQDPDLGLSLGREIVGQYGGTLTGRYRTPGGAELMLRLPMMAMPRQPSAQGGEQKPAH